MGKIIIHGNRRLEDIEEQRKLDFFALSPAIRFKRAVQLMKLGMMFRSQKDEKRNVVVVKGKDGLI